MKLFGWLKFFDPHSHIQYLPIDLCNGKSNKELVDILKKGNISLASGHMIVTELLERLVNKEQ